MIGWLVDRGGGRTGALLAGIATAAVIGVQATAQASAATPPAGSSSSGQYQPGTGGHGQTPANPVVPSAAVKSLQQQLAQLNYYDGPITGVEHANTEQAIQYLQRDAHLPQTGRLNSATRAALTSMLAHGNNQMTGN